jgi:hypothetical protein
MHGHGSIVETVGTFSGPSFRGRPIKFTPERIQQIKNLVERGKSREDIAELVGVTVGSLAVTCSKLGISLRRRTVNNGVSLLRPIKAASFARTSIECGREAPSHPVEVATSTFKYDVAATEAETTPSQEQAQADKMPSGQFTIRMEYKGVECTAELVLTPDMIERLALEAEFRNLRIGELIRDLILSTVKNDLFDRCMAHSSKL